MDVISSYWENRRLEKENEKEYRVLAVLMIYQYTIMIDLDLTDLIFAENSKPNTYYTSEIQYTRHRSSQSVVQ